MDSTNVLFQIKSRKHCLALWLFCVCLLASCDTPPAGDKRDMRVAAAYCECAATLAELDKAAQAIPDTATQVFNAHLEKMQVTFDQTFQCLSPILVELGAVQSQDIPKIQVEIRSKCPELGENTELMKELLCR